MELRPGVCQLYQSDLKQLRERLERDEEFQNRFSRAT